MLQGRVPQTDIHAMVFQQDGGVEITFTEPADQTPDISVMKVLRLDPRRNGRQIEALLSDIREVVDLTLVRLRDDPDELPGR